MWITIVVAILGLVAQVLKLLFGMERSNERLNEKQKKKLGELFARMDELKSQARRVGYGE